MKKIIPFKKDIIFKTNISEITSISLEHSLAVTGAEEISGMFTVSGDYRIADTSINTEHFSYDLPFEINLDPKYKLDHVIIDIDDFYYEITNDNVLSVNIDVLIDKLEEVLIEDEIIDEVVAEPAMVREEPVIEEPVTEEIDPITEATEVIKPVEREFKEIEKILETKEEKRCIEPEEKQLEKGKSLFDNFSDSAETYKSYKVYIVREGDSITSIMEKYKVSKEELENYNDLSDIKINDKIIIPNTFDETD